MKLKIIPCPACQPYSIEPLLCNVCEGTGTIEVPEVDVATLSPALKEGHLVCQSAIEQHRMLTGGKPAVIMLSAQLWHTVSDPAGYGGEPTAPSNYLIRSYNGCTVAVNSKVAGVWAATRATPIPDAEPEA